MEELFTALSQRALVISLLFAWGILITIAAMGAITAAAGRRMGDVGRFGNYFVASIFFVVGLHLLGVGVGHFGRDLPALHRALSE